ncbi:hypothetical protein V6N11_058557 [Hibiscus sabdariffa]|uniref:Transmembrane protein n=1 Tax=Hibiscus sabdariffa TaxID=183260 RepID=A0ABR2U5E7_9ROSI
MKKTTLLKKKFGRYSVMTSFVHCMNGARLGIRFYRAAGHEVSCGYFLKGWVGGVYEVGLRRRVRIKLKSLRLGGDPCTLLELSMVLYLECSLVSFCSLAVVYGLYFACGLVLVLQLGSGAFGVIVLVYLVPS